MVDVAIDPDAMDRVGEQLLVVADAARSSIGAAEVDTARPDAPAGFAATVAGRDLWSSWSRQLDQATVEVARFGHDIQASAAVWRRAEEASRAVLGGG